MTSTITAIARADIPGAPVAMLPMVTSISLNKNDLLGKLMPEIFKMRHLERFELWQNVLTGNIPADIKNLVSLRKLWLYETGGLTGSIPKQIGLLSNLESLFVGGNKLTGALPNMTLMTNLNTLAVNGNALTGTIPTTIAKAIGLERLFFDENKFNGPLPNELGLLTNLTDIRFNNNAFTGTLPIELRALKNLKVLYLYDNEFDGGLDNFLVTGWASMSEYFPCFDQSCLPPNAFSLSSFCLDRIF
jgi:Leucine-rich repeat (LRR) protein